MMVVFARERSDRGNLMLEITTSACGLLVMMTESEVGAIRPRCGLLRETDQTRIRGSPALRAMSCSCLFCSLLFTRSAGSCGTGVENRPWCPSCSSW